MKRLLFVLVCIAQLAVPLSLVARHENTRSSGAPYRFQAAPVDPADPFRGRHVRLSFAADREPVPFADPGFIYYAPDRRVYAELAVGDDGYARLVKVHAQRPAGVDYVDVFTQYTDRPGRSGDAAPAIKVRLPFDRYYLPEARAPQVEAAYVEAARSAQANTYAEVRVRDGHAALVGLVLDGKPVD